MRKYDFDVLNNRYNTGSYKYDRIKSIFPSANRDSIILTIADMDYKTAPEIIDEIKEYTDKGIFGYMTEFYSPYQESIIKWWRKRYDLSINPKEIIFSNGLIQALKAILTLFTKEEDKVVISSPIYGHFSYTIEDECHRQLVDVPLINNNEYYEFDFDKIEEVLNNPLCKIYLLCSPHNPVGRVWRRDELLKLIEICHKTNTLLVSDEAHCDIVRMNVTHNPILKVSPYRENVIMLTSPGKTFNMSGLQCANIISFDENILSKIRNGYDQDISTFAEVASIAAYNKGNDWLDALRKYLDESIKVALDYIKKEMPYCDTTVPEGTYFLWLNFKKTGLSPDEINNIIYKKANVFLQQGNVFSPSSLYYQRMSLSCPREIILEALKRINKAFIEEGVKNEVKI